MGASAPQTLAFALRGPLTRAEVPEVCEQVCALLGDAGAEVALCDVRGLDPDAVTVDVLARLQLTARRHGCELRLRDPSADLVDLLTFMGLRDVLPACRSAAASPTSDEFCSRAESHLATRHSRGGTMATDTSRKIFVNLPVKDLARSVEFFTELGFSFDPRFTDDEATCMIVSDEAFVMLLVESRFKDFTKKSLTDAATETEAIVAVSATSRDEVDQLADKALAAGGSPANDAIDMDSMYVRSFGDPDGHLWEVIWMDPGALQQ
jgi:predicted lactoylglutathione lyase/ABC-type transporter Mla MlaB component